MDFCAVKAASTAAEAIGRLARAWSVPAHNACWVEWHCIQVCEVWLVAWATVLTSVEVAELDDDGRPQPLASSPAAQANTEARRRRPKENG
jgi:hypothetical protein